MLTKQCWYNDLIFCIQLFSYFLMIEKNAYLDTIARKPCRKKLAANLLERNSSFTFPHIPALCSTQYLLIWELFTVIRSAKAMTGGGFLTGVIMMVNIWFSSRLWSISDTEKWKLSVISWPSVSNTAEYLQRPREESNEWATLRSQVNECIFV